MSFLIFICVVVILVLVFNLRARVQRLEQSVTQKTVESDYRPQLQQLEDQQSTVPLSLIDYIKKELERGIAREAIRATLLAKGWQISDIEKAFNSIISPPESGQSVAIPVPEPTSSDRFIEWLKEDWLLKLGAILLLIGFGWLTTYAFLNNWIGPMGRITLGIIAGALFMLVGWWRIKNYITQGGVFLVLGSTTILLTIFAARSVYDFFTPFSALIIMFLSTAFVALASVKYKNRALSLLSLILASVAPLLTKSPGTDHVVLFTYLFVVILGAIWIVLLTGQRELTTASLIIISAYSAPHLFSPSSFPLIDIQTLLLFAYAFAALFFVTNTAGIFKLKNKEILPDLVTAAGNGLFLLVWIMVAAQDEWKSLIISAWMIAFVVGAFFIFKTTQRREPFYVYAGVGIAMLAAATSVELKGAALTIAYTIESGIIALIAYAVLRDVKIAQRVSLLLIGPAILSINSITSQAWAKGVVHEDFFALLVLALTLIGLGIFFLRCIRETENKEPQQTNALLLVIGSVYAYVLLWLSLHAGFTNDNIAVMISLVVYTIIGLVAHFYGLAKEKKGLRIYGGVLIGFVVGRLLLVDVWKMELTGRIITFFLIGALLVSTAFLGRKKNKVIPNNT